VTKRLFSLALLVLIVMNVELYARGEDVVKDESMIKLMGEGNLLGTTANVVNSQPTVEETQPTDGQIGVPLHQHIYIRFSVPMDPSVDLWSAVNISPGVSGDWKWLSDTEIDFRVDPAFIKNTAYTISLSSQIKDIQGEGLIPYTFSFSTKTSDDYECYPVAFQWENVSYWQTGLDWVSRYYEVQFLSFYFPFYQSAYDAFYFNRRSSIWFEFNHDFCEFDLPTAGGSEERVISVYNDALQHIWGQYSWGASTELFDPNRGVVRWIYTYYEDTTEFELILFADTTLRFDYRKCEVDSFYSVSGWRSFHIDGGSGISNGDGIHYSSITENYGPVYELAPASFIFTKDQPPPGKPRELIAYSPLESKFINLEWRQNPEPDLKGCNVYRRCSDNPSYEKLDSTLVNSFVDTMVQLGEIYVYRVTALDVPGLESPYSDSVIVECGQGYPLLNLHVYLQGYYNASTGISRPAEVTVELRNADNPSYIAYTFDVVQIDEYGNLVGGPLILWSVEPDLYRVVIKERNHLSVMTAVAYSFDVGDTIDVDFRNGETAYWPDVGTPHPMFEEPNGKYSLRGGDIDQDGIIFVGDYSNLAQDWNTTDSRSDIDGDGFVFVSDYTILAQNWQKESYVPNMGEGVKSGVQAWGGSKTEKTLPEVFALYQNTPNPFTTLTAIKYTLPKAEYVNLTVYDMTGRIVRTLVKEQQSAGYYDVTWDGRDDSGNSLTTGVYFCRIKAGEFSKTEKLVLMK